jgi:hypothetical protein
MDFPWGKPKQFALDDLWVVVTFLYHGVPKWKQVPMTLDLEASIPKDFESEVGAVTQQVMKNLAKTLDQEATRTRLEFLITSNGLEQMINQGLIAAEAVMGEGNPLHLEAQLWEELASKLTPRVAQGIVDGIRQSLSIHFETLPFHSNPPKERNERMIAVQATRPDFNSKPRPFSGQPMVAQTVVGGAIWEPEVMPFVLPKPWIGNLLQARDHLSFTSVEWGQDPEGTCNISPTPWGRWDLPHPMVDPVVTLPLSAIGCPPDPDKIKEAAGKYLLGSRAQEVLNLIGQHPERQGWFSMVDFLDWEAKKPGKQTTGDDED